MSEQPTPKRRGRPSTGNALTAAERMARTRFKAREAINGADPDLAGLSDTGLFEALRVAYRRGMTWDMASVAAELFRRANPRAVAGQSLEVKISATVADIEAMDAAGRAAPIPATVADIAPAAKPTPDYPPEARRLAVGMKDAGAQNKEIRAALIAHCGRAPDARSLARLIGRWRA